MNEKWDGTGVKFEDVESKKSKEEKSVTLMKSMMKNRIKKIKKERSVH